MKNIFLGGLLLVGTVLVMALGYFFLQSYLEPTTSSGSISPATSTSSTAAAQPQPFVREVPPGAKEFRSDPHHFSVLYPENLTFKRVDAKGNATTLIFQDIKTAQGFQIYITPYQQAQVSEAQFKKDIPSGVRNGLKATSVDGALGASFYSKDTNLGETREVWFVRQGWLYEVTTLKPLESWQDQILGTWKFF